jgi:AraC family transcriptional regulator
MSLTNKALFVIERNLNRDLSLGEIAKRCDVSRFHLAHAFGEAAGMPVMEYVRRRRLTEAAYALASGASDILDLALDIGYGSHEAFSRAFKAQFGRTPEEVRKAESISGLALTDAIRHLPVRTTPLEDPRFQKMDELFFVGLKERIFYGDTRNIPAQWQRFMANYYDAIENKNGAIPAGINLQDDNEGMIYATASEVTRFGKIPSGLAKIVLAPATYAVFEHKDHIAALDETYAAIWNDWFVAGGRTPAEAPAIQRHNEGFDPRTGNGGVTLWIPVQ